MSGDIGGGGEPLQLSGPGYDARADVKVGGIHSLPLTNKPKWVEYDRQVRHLHQAHVLLSSWRAQCGQLACGRC